VFNDARPSWRTTWEPRLFKGSVWGARARAWADLQEIAFGPLHDAAFAAAGVGKGTRLLDVGCGAGLALSMAHARGATVSGLDAAAGLLDIARSRVSDTDLRVAELEELPIADGNFDVVSGFNSFQYAADRVHALAEARRVGTPQGAVIAAVWGNPNGATLEVTWPRSASSCRPRCQALRGHG
jgi:ubiquinone/menaquinone biosynthesis C-methylase UbiE